MSGNVKKYLTWIVIAFILFFVLGQPQEAAGVVRNGLSFLQSAAEAGITFMQALS